MYATCKGWSDLGNGPNKLTATIIGEYSASYHDGALIFTLVRATISGLSKTIWLDFWQHIIDVWHVSGVYAACKGWSDLGSGPNKPTATIIGEYSALYHDGALIFTLVRATISGFDLIKI